MLSLLGQFSEPPLGRDQRRARLKEGLHSVLLRSRSITPAAYQMSPRCGRILSW